MSKPAPGRKHPPSVRLRTLAVLLRDHPRRTVADLMRVGKWLIEAKSLLAHGEFKKWVESVPMIYADVVLATQSARRIAVPVERLAAVQASVARVLTRRKVCRSAKLTEAALAAEPDAAGMVTMRAAQSAVSTVDPWAVHNADHAKEGELEALGRRLTLLANNPDVTSLFVSFDRDTGGDGIPTVSVTLMREGGRQTVTRTTVDAALATLSGDEVAILCKPCGRSLLPASFSKGSHNCKRCERERVGAYTRAKRKRNAETRERIRGMDG